MPARRHTIASHPFFRGLRAPLHISHRGGAKLYPENTLLAFERAVRVHGTDVLELDVHAARDGQLVVAHDETLDRCTDATGPLAALTSGELARVDAAFRFTPEGGEGFPFRGKGCGVPRFAEVLHTFPGLRINVELKTAGAIGPFVELVQQERCLDRLCVGSEHDEIAAELARALPEACVFFPKNALASFVLPVLGGDPPEDDGRFSVLDMPLEWEGVRVFDERVACAAAERGVWVNVWTVDDEATMREVIALGVGGVMTDRPDRLHSVLTSPWAAGRGRPQDG